MSAPQFSHSPAGSAFAVTPSDTANLPNNNPAQGLTCRGLYVGVSGDVAVTPAGNADGTSVVFKAAPVGFLPVACKRVWATGTAATNIVALY